MLEALFHFYFLLSELSAEPSRFQGPSMFPPMVRSPHAACGLADSQALLVYLWHLAMHAVSSSAS